MAASISAVAAICPSAPPITQGQNAAAAPWAADAGDSKETEQEQQREGKPEQEANVRGADRAKCCGQFTLHRVARGLRCRGNQGKNGPDAEEHRRRAPGRSPVQGDAVERLEAGEHPVQQPVLVPSTAAIDSSTRVRRSVPSQRREVGDEVDGGGDAGQQLVGQRAELEALGHGVGRRQQLVGVQRLEQRRGGRQHAEVRAEELVRRAGEEVGAEGGAGRPGRAAVRCTPST